MSSSGRRLQGDALLVSMGAAAQTLCCAGAGINFHKTPGTIVPKALVVIIAGDPSVHAPGSMHWLTNQLGSVQADHCCP